MKGPKFLKFVIPILDVLQENGGAGNSSDVIEKVIEKLEISEYELEETTSSGQSKIRNQIQWARFYLFKGGYIDNSQRGIWRLTNDGLETKLETKSVLKLFKNVQSKFINKDKNETKSKHEIEFDEETTEDEEHTIELLNIIHNIKPSGFEKLCKRLLIEIGLHDIIITGGAGDKGIDGIGLVKINDVVSLNIVFQCKRYKDSVSPHHVRDFRGAMQGRAEKGMIITTGRFTKEARKEANRDGVTPIELIDGERLVSLFEKYNLGLKPITIYELDVEFFKNFTS